MKTIASNCSLQNVTTVLDRKDSGLGRPLANEQSEMRSKKF